MPKNFKGSFYKYSILKIWSQCNHRWGILIEKWKTENPRGSKIPVCYLLRYDRLFATPRTVAHQAPLSMEFPRRVYWSGLPFPSPGGLPNLEMEPKSLYGRHVLYHLSHQGSLEVRISINSLQV